MVFQFKCDKCGAIYSLKDMESTIVDINYSNDVVRQFGTYRGPAFFTDITKALEDDLQEITEDYAIYTYIATCPECGHKEEWTFEPPRNSDLESFRLSKKLLEERGSNAVLS